MLLKSSIDASSKKALIDKDNDALSIKRQCELLGLARSSFYAPEPKLKAFTEEEERAMQIIDEAHTLNSHYGARSHRANLARHGIHMGRYRVAQLMAHMGVRSTSPQPSTSKPAKHNHRFPYLLRGLSINHPNQVWATDITYLPLGKGHVYLSAIIDLYSRFIVGWRLHDTLEAHEVVLCMQQTISKHGVPSIVNSDQGATYTAQEYVDCLALCGIRQSMDGRRRWADNVYIERWFRDLKHDQIYQTEYRTFKELKEVVADYIARYNYQRLHSSLDYETPAEWYFSGINALNMPEAIEIKKVA